MPFRRSDLINGLLMEEEAALRERVRAWDEAKVGTVLAVKAQKLSEWVSRNGLFGTGQRTAQDLVQWISDHTSHDEPFHDTFRKADDARLMLLCRMAQIAGIRISGRQDTATLHDIGLQVERAAVGFLRNFEKEFEGSTTQDLTRHVLEGIFKNWAERFSGLRSDEQDAQIKKLLDVLNSLSSEDVAHLRKILGTTNFEAKMVRDLMLSGTFATALASAVSVSGFAAYTTLTTAMAGAAGFIGLTLPIGSYLFATSLLAFLTNPIVLALVATGGGALLVNRANRKIRQSVLPIFVALSCAQSVGRKVNRKCEGELIELVNGYLPTSPEDRKSYANFERAFPELGML
jgi:hypothetical protein